MASIPGVEDSFEMGRVISRAFGSIGRNVVLFIGLTLLLVYVPNLLLQPFRPDAGDLSGPNASSAGLWLAALSLFGFFCQYILLAALTYVMVSDMNGDRPSFGKALGIGVRFMVPLLLLSIVSIFGIGLGLALFVIPGLIVAIMWSVAAPAMVAERLGVFASLGRSRALTKGWRWHIFWLLVVAYLLTFLPLTLLPLMSGALDAAMAGQLTPGLVVISLFSALATMLLIAIDAAIYIELRAVKEGASTESLASIFA